MVPSTGRSRQLEKRLFESKGTGDATVMKVTIFVVERKILVEPQGTQEREILDLVGGVQPRSDNRQGDDEQ